MKCSFCNNEAKYWRWDRSGECSEYACEEHTKKKNGGGDWTLLGAYQNVINVIQQTEMPISHQIFVGGWSRL